VEGPALIDAACGNGPVQGAPAPVAGAYDLNLDGRFILGRNTTDAFAGTINDAQALVLTDLQGRNQGSRTGNPFIAGAPVQTPYIPGLVDGADVFGLTSLSADDPELADLLASTPGWAGAALYLMDEGPAGLSQAWDGFDMLLLVNLTDEVLTLPRLGVGSQNYVASLWLGGWARSTQFGGAGYEVLTELPADGVYALLVPEGVGDFNLDADGYSPAGAASMAYGDGLYITQLTGDLDGDGFVGINDLNIVLSNWNQNVPPADPNADPSGDGFIGIEDLNVVLGNWNAGAPPAAIGSDTVPEPSTVLLLTLGGALCLSRPRSH
jgi:hypothetical protein